MKYNGHSCYVVIFSPTVYANEISRIECQQIMCFEEHSTQSPFTVIDGTFSPFHFF